MNEKFKGKKFGWLTVIKDLGTFRHPSTHNMQRHVLAKCKCGCVKSYLAVNLKRGATKSCGCKGKHGININSPIYRVWHNMKQRCYNKNRREYKNYGGRGIKICPSWKYSFQCFYKWAMSHGYKEGLLLDRRNNEKGYWPYNCRFVTRLESIRNTRHNLFLRYNGQKKCLSEWSEIIGIKPETISQRIFKLKWPIWKALSTSLKTNQKCA